MKLDLIQLITFGFIVGWVGGQILEVGHNQSIHLGIFIALLTAYINNAHGLIWQWLKRKVSGLRR